MQNVTLQPNGGFILNKCPNCGGAFTVSIEKTGICNPAWCFTKNEPHDIKKAKKWIKAERQKESK